MVLNNMRRTIVHLLHGEAQKAHKKITKDLTDIFGLYPIRERIAPHITIKTPFDLEIEDMDLLFKKVDTFTSSLRQSDYVIKSFGNFGREVIFMDIHASDEMFATVAHFLNLVRTLPKVEFGEYDNGKNFHE